MANFREEFDDFPESDMPTLPAAFVDSSWHNNTCPTFNLGKDYSLWINYADSAQREFPEMQRFGVEFLPDDKDDPSEWLHWGNDLDEALAQIAAHIFASATREYIQGIDPGGWQWREVRRRNAALRAQGPEVTSCASHDFTDSNVWAMQAFAEVYGRDMTAESEEDCAKVNRFWAIASERYLTAGKGDWLADDQPDDAAAIAAKFREIAALMSQICEMPGANDVLARGGYPFTRSLDEEAAEVLAYADNLEGKGV
jgi:hypothetical protein